MNVQASYSRIVPTFENELTEWEFENLVIDNYFFGVSSVSKDGYETPVVFPGAAGRF